MSQLPPHPSLEFLKKLAKELLRDLEQQDPTSKLADAQHAIAKRYGFATWPQLKVHVDSLPRAERASRDAMSPFVGVWTANLARSKPHPLNPFRQATIHVRVADDAVTIDDVVIDASGREERRTNTIQVDGVEHRFPNGYALTATLRGPRVLETFATKDGEPVGWGTYEVSADDSTLTITGEDQVIVLNRMRVAVRS